MALALSLQEDRRLYHALDFPPEDRFHENLRDICGLFVTIIDSKIYLLHQTAREFLVKNDNATTFGAVARSRKWKHSLRSQESHNILAHICIWYLLLEVFEEHPLDANGQPASYCGGYVFLDYAAKHWITHVHELDLEVQKTMIRLLLKLCDINTWRCWTWFRIYWTRTNMDFPQQFTSLILASYLGLGTVVKHLLKTKDVNSEAQDASYRRTALSWAAGQGFEVVVKLLIENAGALRRLKLPLRKVPEIDIADKYGRTPLFYAVWNGNPSVVKQLLNAGAQADSEDEIGGTPLSYAVCYRHEKVIDLLFKSRTQLGIEEDTIKHLLFSAAQKGDEVFINQLLDTGKVDINWEFAINGYLRTPLFVAAEKGHAAIVKLLLETGKADKNSKYVIRGRLRTPLSVAKERNYWAIVRLLSGPDKADINSKLPIDYAQPPTALFIAADKGNLSVLKRLLDTAQVDINPQCFANDGYVRTPLFVAAEKGHHHVVKLLLDTNRANINLRDRYGWTPLSIAAGNGHSIVVRQLLETGRAEVSIRNTIKRYGVAPLTIAVANGHLDVVKLLLEMGWADPNYEDDSGNTPLQLAIMNQNWPVVELLQYYELIRMSRIKTAQNFYILR